MTLFIETNRKLAALRQIDAAIKHLHGVGVECAITLAAAAENLLPATKEPHIFQYLEQHSAFKNKEVDFNETINWLKHPIGSDAKVIFQQEAALIILRAMSKFVAVYKEAPTEWDEFLKWGATAGFWPDIPSTTWKDEISPEKRE